MRATRAAAVVVAVLDHPPVAFLPQARRAAAVAVAALDHPLAAFLPQVRREAAAAVAALDRRQLQRRSDYQQEADKSMFADTSPSVISLLVHSKLRVTRLSPF